MQKGLMKLKSDVWTQLKAAAFHYGLTPSSAYRLIERVGLQNMVARVAKSTRNNVIGKFLSFDSVDWTRTVAYSMGHVGQIYLNVAGREPQGIVKADNYYQTRQEVMAALQELCDEYGHPILTSVIPGEESYNGPYARQGPDLHLVLDNYNMIACPLFATEGRVITHQIRGDSGCHRREGIFIAQGQNIRQNVLLPEANIYDLAPTILHMMGLPVPQVMDGRVLTEIFASPSQVTYADDIESATVVERGFSNDEATQVQERLRSLGYL
jgi:predicted AlkP superfamily phosphohydrolase/phosphomutase